MATDTPKVAAPKPLVARDLLAATHPLNAAFVAWLGGKLPTRRQAAAFLAAYPQYRVAQVAG
jgi:hypothetical protein